MKLRLRTKLLLSLLLVCLGLTSATLTIVQRVVERQVRRNIREDLRESVRLFRSLQRQQEADLSRAARLLADLPILKALLTTRDAPTIQDVSGELWNVAASGLFVIADRAGKVVALHVASPGFSPELAQQSLQRSLTSVRPVQWWYGAGHLYQVILQPVYFGRPSNERLLGILVLGHEIDAALAGDLSRFERVPVAFRYGDSIVVSTLNARQHAELATWVATRPADAGPRDLELAGERYLYTSVDLSDPADGPVVRLSVLQSYDAASAFLSRLHRLLLLLGLVAVAVGSGAILLVSHRFTRPLKTLVAGVRSLEMGDFAYPLGPYADDEVAEVTSAFDRMRRTLQSTQQKLLESERLATIGTMAGSISHDLRHSLTAVVANAEFLCMDGLKSVQREEFYQEIRVAADQMTGLIDSLLELSRNPQSLRRSQTSVESILRRALSGVHAHPRWQRVPITIISVDPGEGWFDEKRLQRVFYNLLLNACEAAPPDCGRVDVLLRRHEDRFEVLVHDNGGGVPEQIRDRLFQPFVSFGKENGTGMGLGVARKILQDHGGDIALASTSAAGSSFKVVLPIAGRSEQVAAKPSPSLSSARAA